MTEGRGPSTNCPPARFAPSPPPGTSATVHWIPVQKEGCNEGTIDRCIVISRIMARTYNNITTARASAVPPDPSPCLEREGTRQGLRHAVFGAIRGPVPGRGCGDPARQRRLPVQRTYDVSRSGLPSASSRAPSAAESSRIPETRVDGDGPGPGLVLGYHTAAGAEEVELLLPLRHHGHLQPLHRGMDGGGSGELGLGRAPDPAELPEAWRPAPGPDLSTRIEELR